MQAHAKQLTAIGHSVTIYCAEDEMTKSDDALWKPVLVQSYARSGPSFAYAPGIQVGLLIGDHDILHQHGLWQYPSLAALRWQRRTERPVVISTQGMLEPWALANAKFKKRIAAWLYQRANLASAACIQCSASEVAGVRSFGLKNPIAVLPNGADLPDPNSQTPRPSWLPVDARRTLLFLGRLHPKKGIRETLDAWALLTARHPDIARSWRLVFVGWDDGNNADAFRAHARTLGLTDVIFPGPVYGQAVQSAYAHADAFILASHSEGLPMAVLEAWSHALPVFMTRECNLMEGFTSGSAIQVTTDAEAMAQVLSKRLEDPGLALVGERGRDLVRSHFSWPVIGRQLSDVYHWLVGKGSKPECVRLD